jgi:hypothetical protein
MCVCLAQGGSQDQENETGMYVYCSDREGTVSSVLTCGPGGGGVVRGDTVRVLYCPVVRRFPGIARQCVLPRGVVLR